MTVEGGGGVRVGLGFERVGDGDNLGNSGSVLSQNVKPLMLGGLYLEIGGFLRPKWFASRTPVFRGWGYFGNI